MPYRGSRDPSRGPPVSYHNSSRRQSSGRRRSRGESTDVPRQAYGTSWGPPDPTEMDRRAGMDLPPLPQQSSSYQSHGWEPPQQSSGYQGAYNTRVAEPSNPMPMPMPNIATEPEPQLRRRSTFTRHAPSYQDEKYYADGPSPGFMDPELMNEEEFIDPQQMGRGEAQGFDGNFMPQDYAYRPSRSVAIAPNRRRNRSRGPEPPFSPQRPSRSQSTSRSNGQSSKPYYTTKPRRIRKDSTMVKIAQHLARHW